MLIVKPKPYPGPEKEFNALHYAQTKIAITLRILVSYEAKTAKISNFWTCWPVKVLFSFILPNLTVSVNISGKYRTVSNVCLITGKYP